MERVENIIDQLNSAWYEFMTTYQPKTEQELDEDLQSDSFIEDHGVRSKSAIYDEISDLKKDIVKAERAYKRGSISNELYEMLKDRYTGYIECFQYALGEVDCYGRNDDFLY